MPAIEEILRCAREAGASDVHMSVGHPPRMRVNGVLHTMNFGKLQPEDTLDILLGIMPKARQEYFEERGESEFSFSVSEDGRCRVNAYRQRGNVTLAFRLVGKEIPSPEELGIPESVTELCRYRQGLVLITGPSGSGKSTTLASLVDRINSSREVHVLTLESPIEYLHQHKLAIVNQREIGSDSESYVSALGAALRQDSDVIMVGELRDKETISLALTAAETGHLVFSTLQTMGAANTIDRILELYLPYQQQQIRQQLANVLEAVVSQQLIPEAEGQGRVAAFEVLHANQAIRNLIREGKSQQISSVMQTNRKQGMVPMDEAILRLYQEGRISRKIALQYVQDEEILGH